jgi:flagellar hook-associated protein 2
MASPIRMTGMTSGLDTESIVSALVSNYSTKVDKLKKEQTKLGWKQETWKEVNTEVYGLYTAAGNLRFSSAYNLKKSVVSDATKATVSTSNVAAVGSHTLKITSLAKSAYWTGDKMEALKTDRNPTGKVTEGTALTYLLRRQDKTGKDGKTTTEYGTEGWFEGTGYIKVKSGDKEKLIEVNGETTIASLKTQFAEVGINLNFDEGNQRIFLNAAKSGSEHNFSVEAVDAEGNAVTDGSSVDALEVLGIGSKANKIVGSDAKFIVDGTEYTSDSNTITVNGLTINALAKTTEEITINTSADVQGLYDKIKDFFTQYNNVINDLTSRYNAESAKDMQPLTDEERQAMGEATANKYEDKIKNALLRRDTTIDTIISTMNRSMMAGFEINGQKISLGTYGIQTLGILNASSNEQYALHINGDADDTAVSGKEDKLMKALTEDPDTVMQFMQKLFSGMYDALGDKMKSTSMSSAYTIYNDKQMEKEYKNYNSLIKQWEDKVEEMEDRYYKKFAKMESALSNLNSQQSSISGFFQ